MSILLYLGSAMLAGMLMTRITRLIHLPNVTGYLIAGVLIGPYAFHLLGHETVGSLSLITQVALGFIAFSIGDEFKLEALKAIGMPALTITLLEALGAVFLVDILTFAFGFPPAECIVLGALAASTAPAATLMIVRQYKASGPLTSMLLPVVAADDAIGLIAYSISISIAVGMVNHQAFSVVSTILVPIGQILLSLLIGGLMGLALSVSHRYFRSHTNRMALCISAVFICAAIADHFGLSALLMCMALGSLYVNTRHDAEKILHSIDDWTYPLFMLFFVISGAELDITALPKVGLLGVLYILSRFGGKWLGSFIGSTITKQPKVVKNYIGFALMPQAGVAIGLASLVITQLPGGLGSQIQTIILSATLIHELIGPLSAKFALQSAGEIHIS